MRNVPGTYALKDLVKCQRKRNLEDRRLEDVCRNNLIACQDSNMSCSDKVLKKDALIKEFFDATKTNSLKCVVDMLEAS